MKIVTMHDAKTHLSRLVDMALAGEDVVIARRDHPLVRLSINKEKAVRRKVGIMPNLIKKMNEHFNEALEDWDDSILPATSVPLRRKK